MKQAQGAPTPRSATQTALPGPVPLHAGLKCRLGFWLETTTATTATGGPCSVVLSRCISQEIWGEVAQKSRKKIKKKYKNTPELGSGFIPTRPSYPFHLLVVTGGANDIPQLPPPAVPPLSSRTNRLESAGRQGVSGNHQGVDRGISF